MVCWYNAHTFQAVTIKAAETVVGIELHYDKLLVRNKTDSASVSQTMRSTWGHITRICFLNMHPHRKENSQMMRSYTKPWQISQQLFLLLIFNVIVNWIGLFCIILWLKDYIVWYIQKSKLCVWVMDKSKYNCDSFWTSEIFITV